MVPQVTHTTKMPYGDRQRYNTGAQSCHCYRNDCVLASTGALQILAGVVSVVLGIVVVIEEFDTGKSPVAMPVWAGGWYALTGIFGLAVLCSQNRAMTNTYLVMSLLAAILGCAQIVWESIAATIHKDEYEECYYPHDGSSFDCFERLAEYMHIAAAVVAGIEIIVATFGWAFAVCRSGCRFDCMPEKEVVVVSRPQPHSRRPQSQPRRNYFIDASIMFIP